MFNMRKIGRGERGFTLMELLVVLAIGLVISSVVLASLSGFRSSGAMEEANGNVFSLLHEARNLTLASKGDTHYGLHLETARVVLFSGSYVEGAVGNEVTTLPSSVSLGDISLVGGGDDVIFDRLTGATSQSGTFTIKSDDSSRVATTTIYSTGVIEQEL